MIPKTITTPILPKFLMAPDEKTMELYIVSTSPIALIWVRQTVPAQLYIVEGLQDAQILKDCAEWYREFVSGRMHKN